MDKLAVYPGSFDPITNGHVDLICRASKIFEKLIIGVAHNPRKKTLFSADERVEIIREALATDRIKVQAFDGLLVDFLKKVNADVVIRGLRAISDFEYEFQMAITNRTLYPRVETFFLMACESYVFLSSGMVKEIAMFGGDVTSMVPESVCEHLRNRIKKIKSDHLDEAPSMKPIK